MIIKRKTKKIVSLLLSSFLAGMLASGNYVHAAGTAIGAGTVPEVVELSVSKGHPLRNTDVPVKQFEVLTGASGLAADENGVVPATGQLLTVELSTGPSDGSCYVLLADSATASGLTLTTAGRLIVPPVVAKASETVFVSFAYPKPFTRGLYVLVSTPSVGTCRATVGWKRPGSKS